jgi:hypothetical protein
MSWHINILVAGLIRSMVLVFVSILYFKMYDFFYIYPLAKKQKDNTDKNGKASKADLEGDNNAN